LKAGEIYWVNLDPTIGNEIKKKRPVVVINPGHEKQLQLAIVVPVTSWTRYWENNPFFVTLKPGRSGLKKKSAVDCFQIRAVSHKRFTGRIGHVSNREMDQVKSSMALILDIDVQHCL